VHVARFLTVGLTGFTIMRRGMATIPRSVRTSRSFFTFPNVKPFDAILARFTIELVLTMLGGVIMLFLIWWFLDLTIRMDRFLQGMGVFGLLCVAAFGMSLFLGVYGTRFPVVMTVLSFSGRALLILSAVIHPASELPTQAQAYIAWNPIAHALELMRYYFLGMKPFQTVSMTYLTGFSVIMLCLGFMSYYANRQKVIER
jgi:capsular polysaccharide transport system permease protein